MGILKRLAREPLLHFVVAGSLLFVGGRIYQQQTSIYRIVVTPGHVTQLANRYALQFGSKPDATTLNTLVDQDVHDEILFRQGLAMKLEQDDEIVRRRIIQKMQFLLQDLKAPPEPTQAQLTRWYQAHAADYTTPPRVTFTHIFFDEAKGDAQARAKQVLARLPDNVMRAPTQGDPFPDLYDFDSYEPVQVNRLFGHTDLAKAVFTASPGHWTGPLRSAYGWHLVYISKRTLSHQPTLSDVRDKVRADWLQAAQDRTNRTAFAELATEFRIIREDKQP